MKAVRTMMAGLLLKEVSVVLRDDSITVITRLEHSLSLRAKNQSLLEIDFHVFCSLSPTVKNQQQR